MDRLSTLIALGLVGCAGESASTEQSSPSRSRVNAVAKPAEEDPEPVDVGTFCDQRDTSDAAPKLAWPELRKPAGAGGTARWVNVWATWCAPCVSELPRLTEWKKELGAKADFELVFVSADGDADAVAEFAAKHPEVKDTLELTDAAALAPWLEGMGMQRAGSLPVHLFVDSKDQIRCVRSSEILEEDKAAVGELLASLQ